MTEKTYRNGGRWITQGLFLEQSYTDTTYVIYTLQDEDHPRGYLSLYKLYMASNDPMEYTFANTHLGGWDHWEALSKAKWFQPYIQRWRKELELKIKAEALLLIREEAAAGGKNSFVANKFLLEKGWVESPEGKRGRPKKQEIIQEADLKELKSDFERINLQ